MIGHAIDLKQFVAMVLDNAGHISVKLHFPGGLDEAQPVLHCEHSLDMDLCIGVSHELCIYFVPKGTIVCQCRVYHCSVPSGTESTIKDRNIKILSGFSYRKWSNVNHIRIVMPACKKVVQ